MLFLSYCRLMKTILHELKSLCDSNRDGSYASQTKRRNNLELFAHQLEKELNFPRMHARSLKEKHVKELVNLWLSQGLAINTIKARMSTLRWWAEKVGKPHTIKPNNRDYGIADRQAIPKRSRACDIDLATLNTIKDEHVVASLRLARAFGLRKEEAIKFTPSYADQGDHIRLKASWCKGGKERTVPILNQEQRDALNNARQVAGLASLIPPDKQYFQQRNHYEKLTNQAGFRNLHGLRHRYAQLRYEALTGWPSPHAGGPRRCELGERQKAIDIQARLFISKELGHERLQIAATYLGS